MSCVALIAVSLSMQNPALRLPVEAYKLPIIGGHREIVMGPVLHRSELLPHYGIEIVGTMSHQTLNERTDRAWLDEGERKLLNYNDKAIGHMAYAVKTDTYEGNPCLVIESDSRYQQSIKHNTYGWVQLNNKARSSWWVKEDGTILRHTYTVSLASGEWYLDAIYLSSAIALVRRTPQGSSQMTLTPSCGMEAMQEMFKPMVVGGKIVKHDKTYYTLNPITGAPEKHTVRSRGTFNGKFASVKVKGNCWEMVGPKFEQKAFVSETGDLVKIELPNNEFIHINSILAGPGGGN